MGDIERLDACSAAGRYPIALDERDIAYVFETAYLSADACGFFKSLALMAGAASISPQIFIPKFEPVKWKVTPANAYEEILMPFREFDPRFFGKWQFVMEGGTYPHNAGNVLRHEDVERVAYELSPWEL